MSIVGKNMRKIRNSKNLTLQDVADKIDSSPIVISRYERNERKPNSEMISKIADVLQVDVSEFYKYVDPRLLNEMKSYFEVAYKELYEDISGNNTFTFFVQLSEGDILLIEIEFTKEIEKNIALIKTDKKEEFVKKMYNSYVLIVGSIPNKEGTGAIFMKSPNPTIRKVPDNELKRRLSAFDGYISIEYRELFYNFLLENIDSASIQLVKTLINIDSLNISMISNKKKNDLSFLGKEINNFIYSVLKKAKEEKIIISYKTIVNNE